MRAAFGELADVISPQNLELPYWLLNFDEMKELIIGESSRTPEIDASILNYVIVEAKKKLASGQDYAITVDTPVPYRLSDVDPHHRRSDGQVRAAAGARALHAHQGPLQRAAGRPRAMPSCSRASWCATR